MYGPVVGHERERKQGDEELREGFERVGGVHVCVRSGRVPRRSRGGGGHGGSQDSLGDGETVRETGA